MLKRLRRLTIFKVQTPRVQSRRPILSQWPGQKRVGGGGPPRGVTIESAAHRRWAGRVEHMFKFLPMSAFPKLLPILPILRGFWPLSFSLPGGRAFRKADQKIFLWSPLPCFFSNFCASKMHFYFCFENTSKKTIKIRILASQNHPKTSQNGLKIDVQKNMWFFNAFFTTLCKIFSVETLKISIFPGENHYF